MCHLIPRFYTVSSGRILIDGQDIPGLTLHSLRTQVGVVQQDVYLFSGTVYENISYGRNDADRDSVIQAAKHAGAHSFIEKLPQFMMPISANGGSNFQAVRNGRSVLPGCS